MLKNKAQNNLGHMEFNIIWILASIEDTAVLQ